MQTDSSPLVSIVVPTKNRVELLRETLNSVSRQSFDRWECLVVDDGSTDATAEMVNALARADSRIRILFRSGTLAGANVCRNIGFNASLGEFVIFLDSDDLLAAGCLTRRVEVMQRNLDLDFAVFRADVFKESANIPLQLWHPQRPGDDLSRFLQHECLWQTSGPIWRRSAFETFGSFDETLLSMQDFELHVRILAKGARHLKFDDIDHHIRSHSFDVKTSSRHFTDPTYLHGVRNLPLQFLELLTEADLLTWSRRRFLGGLVFANAENWAKIGNLKEAWRVWWSALGTGLVEARIVLPGLAALTLLRIAPIDGGIAQRAVAKWKGWVRFRQEPSLIKTKQEN